MIAAFGSGVVAAYGVANRVSALGIMMVVGMGLGMSALTGQNLGAGKIWISDSMQIVSADRLYVPVYNPFLSGPAGEMGGYEFFKEGQFLNSKLRKKLNPSSVLMEKGKIRLIQSG